MRQAAEELIDRLPGDPPPQIPQGEVDRRAAARLRPGAGEADIGNEIAVQALDLQRIAAEQNGRRGFMNERLRRARAEKGLAEAYGAFIGVKAYPDKIGEFVVAYGIDARDFHGSPGAIQ
jgi:hypothetical protein